MSRAGLRGLPSVKLRCSPSMRLFPSATKVLAAWRAARPFAMIEAALRMPARAAWQIPRLRAGQMPRSSAVKITSIGSIRYQAQPVLYIPVLRAAYAYTAVTAGRRHGGADWRWTEYM